MSDCFDHAAEAYDDLIFGRTSEGEPDWYQRNKNRQPLGITCKYCGALDLHWFKVGGKWRLHSHGVVHSCYTGSLLEDGTK